MNRFGKLPRFIRFATIMIALVAALGATPSFAQTPPDFVIDAGVACSFALGVSATGGHPVYKEFRDKNGNLVRTLNAGTGPALTLINMNTGAELPLRSNGSGTHTTYNADGTQTVALTGHTILILYPTDIPAGPSTTLYVGRVLYTVDTNSVFEVQQTSGKSLDICAALSS